MKNKRNRIYNVMLCLLLTASAASGIMISLFRDVMIVKMIHKLSSLIFVIMVIKHILCYRRKI